MADASNPTDHKPDRLSEKIRIEDHVRMFHASCGGMVTGILGRKLTCSECGREMRAFVADEDEVNDGSK